MYFSSLNFVRFLLAIGVVFYHYGLLFYPFNTGVVKDLIQHSVFRVSFFFFISGFVLTLAYYSKANDLLWSDFFMKRVSRLLPLFLIAFIVTLLFVLLYKNESPRGLSIILQVLGLQAWNPGFVLDLNYPAWSLSVEIFFYLLFPFIIRWASNQSMQKIFLWCLVLWVLQSIQHIYFCEQVYEYGNKTKAEFIDAFPLWHLSTFCTGITGAILVARNGEMSVRRLYTGTGLFLSVLLFVYIIFIPNSLLKYAHNGLLAPLFLLFTLSLYYHRSRLQPFFSSSLSDRLGKLSYGIFIFQYPVWLCCDMLFAKQLWRESSLFFLVYLSVLLLVAVAVNRWVELPAMEYLRARYKRDN